MVTDGVLNFLFFLLFQTQALSFVVKPFGYYVLE